MDNFRESPLEWEGAQAAARGQHWRSNPILLKDNMPQASGESLGDWSRRHDAWIGYERLCDAVAYAKPLAMRCGASTLQEHQP